MENNLFLSRTAEYVTLSLLLNIGEVSRSTSLMWILGRYLCIELSVVWPCMMDDLLLVSLILSKLRTCWLFQNVPSAGLLGWW